MIRVLFVVLCAGILQFSLAANRLRNFTYYLTDEGRVTWDEAQKQCEHKGGSLLSLYDEEDANLTHNLSAKCDETDRCFAWLGLRIKNETKWSNGKVISFNQSTVTVSNGTQLCEFIENGTWKGSICSEEKPFMCQKDSMYKFVDTEKNWCRALQHCRTHFDDLASIENETQNEELRNKSQGRSFWIGLQHDELEWADDICSTYRPRVIERDETRDCLYIKLGLISSWNWCDCDQEERVICSKGSVKIRVIKEAKTWAEALNYCKEKHSRLLWIENEWDQKAVEQWLNVTYTGSTKRLWIGLKQSAIFGFWIWSDRVVHYHNWKNGKQPDMPLSNHCGVIDAETYDWSDENCWSELPFLCEEDIIYMKRK